MSLNRVTLLGHLGQDPILQETQSGNSVCNLSIATNDSWVDKSGQRQERTEWHRIVVWGKRAENCAKYLSKGRECLIEGYLQTRTWEDKEGNTRYTTEIVASNVQFVGGGKDQQQTQSQGQYQKKTKGESGPLSKDNDYHFTPDPGFTADNIPF